MCQACVDAGEISQWLYDVIEAFVEQHDGSEYGFGHIVLDDGNVQTNHIEWCLNEAERDGRPSDAAVEKFLRWMLTVPEHERGAVYED